MGKRGDLTKEEKKIIIQELEKSSSTLEIAKKLKRDHRTIKRFCKDGSKERKRADKGKFRAVNARQIRKIKVEVSRKPYATSKTIFEDANVKNVSRPTRCKVLKTVASVKKAIKAPPLTKNHKESRKIWAEQYMKCDFSTVIFTDECRATLDGPDCWSRGWLGDGQDEKVRLRRQQGGGGVMFWAAIVNDELIGPFRVEDGVKINSVNYCEFLNDHFLPWFKKQPKKKKQSLIFMQDNAPSHVSQYSRTWLEDKGFVGERIMQWPANSPDLNPIENLWAIIKREVYKNGKQYQTNDDLWRSIEMVSKDISRTTIHI